MNLSITKNIATILPCVDLKFYVYRVVIPKFNLLDKIQLETSSNKLKHTRA